MTKDQIIAMAIEAGFTPTREEYVFVEMLETFAQLVAADAQAKNQVLLAALKVKCSDWDCRDRAKAAIAQVEESK
jgi:hypothetical protein